MYPFEVTLMAEGTTCVQTKYTIVADIDEWGFSTLSTAPPFASGIGRNSAFEVFAVQQYWTDWQNSHVASYSYPMFQVAANPLLITGENNFLERIDKHGITGYFTERPACTTINKPNWTVGTFSSDLYPPADNVNFTEPDAIAIRFGYTDQ